MRRKSLIVLLVLMGSFICGWSKSKPDPVNVRIVIIRHAEKPEKGDNLSCKGFNRSLQIPDMLIRRSLLPNYIYVPALETGKTTKSGRMLQTVGPLAIKYNIAINTKFEVNETAALSKSILNKKGTVLVVWEHGAIQDILSALGVKRNLKWQGDDFDGMLIITVKEGKTSIIKSQEGLKPTDSCKF